MFYLAEKRLVEALAMVGFCYIEVEMEKADTVQEAVSTPWHRAVTMAGANPNIHVLRSADRGCHQDVCPPQRSKDVPPPEAA